MSAWKIAGWLGDRANPIVVKEIRQSVRSKSYIGLYFVMLLASVIIALVACGSQAEGPPGTARAIGGDVFVAYLACLAVAGLLILPLMALGSLGNERMENTYELLNVSGLAPGRLVRGKLGAAVLELALIYSAFVPFMAFTYFLRGIDLPQMLLFISVTFVASVFVIMLAIAASSMATTKRALVTMQIVFFLFLMVLGYFLAFAAFDTFFFGRVFGRGFLAIAGDLRELIWFLVVLACVLGSYFVILYLLAVSRLTFLADNRSTALRVAILAQTLLFFGLQYYGSRGGTAPEGWLPLGAFLVVQWGIVGACVVAEPDALSRRVAVSVPRRRLFRILLAPFWPGGTRGWAFLIVGLILVLAMTYGGPHLQGSTPSSMPGHPPGYRYSGYRSAFEDYIPLVLAGQILFYLGLVNFLFRTVLRKWRTPHTQRVTTFILVGVGCVLPIIIEGACGMEVGRDAWLHAFNPFGLSISLSRGAEGPMVLVLLVGAVVLLFHLRLVARGYRELHTIAAANHAAVAPKYPRKSSEIPSDTLASRL